MPHLRTRCGRLSPRALCGRGHDSENCSRAWRGRLVLVAVAVVALGVPRRNSKSPPAAASRPMFSRRSSTACQGPCVDTHGQASVHVMPHSGRLRAEVGDMRQRPLSDMGTAPCRLASWPHSQRIALPRVELSCELQCVACNEHSTPSDRVCTDRRGGRIQSRCHAASGGFQPPSPRVEPPSHKRCAPPDRPYIDSGGWCTHPRCRASEPSCGPPQALLHGPHRVMPQHAI